MATCPFCAIGAHYPDSPTAPSALALPPALEPLAAPAFVVLSTPLVLAFLDIMPLAPGHLLVTTRRHREKIDQVGDDEARALGLWLPRLSRVLSNVTGVHDWNIVQNNGPFMSPPVFCLLFFSSSYYMAGFSRCVCELTGSGAAAAQVVPHVHFHIIPRPALTPELRNRSFTMFGRGQRTDLDEDEAAALTVKLRAEVARELERVEDRERL